MTARLCICLILAAFTLSSKAAFAEFDASQKSGIEEIVRDYIMNNPQVIKDALARLEQEKLAADLAARKKQVLAESQRLFHSSRQVVLGNKSGSVTLVEFFDYNCGYCKKAHKDLIEILATEKDLRIVLKELPILGQNSLEASKISIAVRMQDANGERFLKFHNTLYESAGPVDRAMAYAAAASAGCDMAKLDGDLLLPEIQTTIDESISLAKSLGIRGTPNYVLQDEVIVGAVGAAAIRSKLKEIALR